MLALLNNPDILLWRKPDDISREAKRSVLSCTLVVEKKSISPGRNACAWLLA
jgi:hypothetical protein